ncbi:MAG: V-type ATP synthase subunit E [Planctomycetota bacterium]|nr:V-type ATP synthase subunit E [Planctomycetota bacterium]
MTAANANPHQALQDEILADARRRADETVDKARREADAVLAKARADAESERQAALKAAEAEARRRHGLVLAAIPIRIARRRAECVEAALEKVHDEARRRLEAREGFDPRGEGLTRLAAEALAAMEGNRFVLQVSDADRQALGDAWLDEVRRRVGRQGLELSMGQGDAAIRGGVVVRDDEGRQVWDNSLAARLARLWPALRCEIAAAAGLVPAARRDQKESP